MKAWHGVFGPRSLDRAILAVHNDGIVVSMDGDSQNKTVLASQAGDETKYRTICGAATAHGKDYQYNTEFVTFGCFQGSVDTLGRTSGSYTMPVGYETLWDQMNGAMLENFCLGDLPSEYENWCGQLDASMTGTFLYRGNDDGTEAETYHPPTPVSSGVSTTPYHGVASPEAPIKFDFTVVPAPGYANRYVGSFYARVSIDLAAGLLTYDDNYPLTITYTTPADSMTCVRNRRFHKSVLVGATSVTTSYSEDYENSDDGDYFNSWLLEYGGTVTYSDPYTLGDVSAEALAMANAWKMNDDILLPWGSYRGGGPLVSLNELPPTPPAGRAGRMPNVPYAPSPEAGPRWWLPFGATMGGPPEPVGTKVWEPYRDFLAESSDPIWSLVLAAVGSPGAQCLTGNLPCGGNTPVFPCGAMVQLNTIGNCIGGKLFEGYVIVSKHAKTMEPYNSYNWFRPCGADRDDPRFPGAWPICGRVGVASISQSGGNSIFTLAGEAPYLRTADQIDATGITPALSGVPVIGVASPTQFTVAGSYAIAEGQTAYVSSHAAPDYRLDDEQPEGNVICAEWSQVARTSPGGSVAINYSCTDVSLPFGPCCPRVVCYGNTETDVFRNGITRPLGGLPTPDVRDGSKWQGIGVGWLRDPLSQAVPLPRIEARCEPPLEVNGVPTPPLPYGIEWPKPVQPSPGCDGTDAGP